MFARYFASLLALLVFTVAVHAEEAAPSSAKVKIGEDLQQLILQLDADSYSDRLAASEALAKQGAAAVPALEQGTQSDSLEVSLRSFELLTKLFSSEDAAGKKAAKEALQRLSQQESSMGRQAKLALVPPRPAQGDLNGFRGGAIRLGVARPAIAVERAIAVRKSVSVSVTDGVKTIKVDDNGKKINIVEDKEKGISGSITETKEEKETVEKFAAKNAEELKEKFPEAFKLYEQYALGGGVKVEAVLVGEGGIVARAEARAVDPKEALEERIKRLQEQIEKVQADTALPEEVKKKAVASYERLLERYKESLKELK